MRAALLFLFVIVVAQRCSMLRRYGTECDRVADRLPEEL